MLLRHAVWRHAKRRSRIEVGEILRCVLEVDLRRLVSREVVTFVARRATFATSGDG